MKLKQAEQGIIEWFSAFLLAICMESEKEKKMSRRYKHTSIIKAGGCSKWGKDRQIKKQAGKRTDVRV